MARVVIRGEELANLLRNPAGEVGRHIITLAERVQTLAKQQVGYDDRKPAGRPDASGGPNQAAGGQHLRDTIVKRIVQEPGGIAVYVGSSHPIALMHHEGTRPHEIRPKKASVLAFEMNGQVVFATVVNHPGHPGNPYLTRPLEQVMASVGASRVA